METPESCIVFFFGTFSENLKRHFLKSIMLTKFFFLRYLWSLFYQRFCFFRLHQLSIKHSKEPKQTVSVPCTTSQTEKKTRKAAILSFNQITNSAKKCHKRKRKQKKKSSKQTSNGALIYVDSFYFLGPDVWSNVI